jgi:hypothetical protein
MRHVISFRTLWVVIFGWMLLDAAFLAWGHMLPPSLQIDAMGALNRDISTAWFILSAWIFFRESAPRSGSEG